MPTLIGIKSFSFLYSYKTGVGKSILYSYLKGVLYKYITPALDNGAHTIKITAFDELDNESAILSGTITIDTYLRPAEQFSGELKANNSIDLTWDKSPDDADATFFRYNIYDNNGSGEIDFATPQAQKVAGSISHNTGILGNGDWKHAIRVEKTDGKIEQNVNNIVRIKIPDVPPPPGLPGSRDDDTQLTVIPETGGKARLFMYYPYEEATHFHIYWQPKGSLISHFSLSAPNEEFDRSADIIQDHLTPRITSEESRKYFFVCRAVNSSNREEENKNIVAATLDGKAPQQPTTMTLTAIMANEDGDIE